MKPLVLVGLGALAGLGFEPYALWPLTLIAAAVLLVWIDRAPTARYAFISGWWFALGHYGLGFNWIATAFTFQAAMPPALGWVAVAGVAGLMALYPALAAWAAWALGHNLLTRSLWFASAWMAGEWARGHLLSGFAWNPLGAIWLPVPMISHAAASIGAIGLSGLVWLAAAALTIAVLRPMGYRVVLGFATMIFAGLWMMNNRSSPADQPVKLALVQANIGQGERYADPSANLAVYAELTRRAFAAGADVAVWPEGAVQFLVDEDPQLRAFLAALVPAGKHLLFGGDHLERRRDGRIVAARNSLYALNAQAQITGRYDKAHLVPLGEYLPLRALVEPLGLARLVPGDIDFWPGAGPKTLHLAGLPAMGVQICYEIIFPARVVDAADRPAWLLVVSNDAWFGGDGAPQHFAQARLRAIEEGLPVVRATPTGITGVIDAHGGVRATLPRFTAQVLGAKLPGALPPTLFARFGHMTTLLLGLLLAASAFGLRRRADSHRAADQGYSNNR